METQPERDSSPKGDSLLSRIAKELIREREYWQGLDWQPNTPEPPEPPRPDRYKLRWVDAQEPDTQAVISLTEARKQIAGKMRAYLAEKRPGRMLLIKAQPGVGKTYAGVELAQELAAQGKRILYVMPTHRHFETLSAMEHFQPELWYHWLASNATSPTSGQTMCLYPQAFATWSEKGYATKDLCNQLCPMYQANCEYRRQAMVTQPIIAGVHEHLATGIKIEDFDLVLIDELPIRSFLKSREIPRTGIEVAGVGPVARLAKFLREYPIAANEVIKGPDLLNLCGDYLIDAQAQMEDYGRGGPQPPTVQTPEQVENIGYWYLPDLLKLAQGELQAHAHGWAAWAERIYLSKKYLKLLKRKDPWDGLPAHIIALDATGNGPAYQQLLERKVEVMAPNVKRIGRVHQVTGRLNGISTMLEIDSEAQPDKHGFRGRRLSSLGRDAYHLVEALIEKCGYKAPGVVTFQGAEKEFEKLAAEKKTLHFFNQRGANDLEGCDGLFVVGCPQPGDDDIMEQVKILYPRRIKPFLVNEAGSGFVAARCEIDGRYNIFVDGKQAVRITSGFWNDADLETIAAVYREDELVQAIHRSRLISNDVDVWLLTSVPTGEPLESIYDSPEDIFNQAPVGWKAWLRIINAVPGWAATGAVVGMQELKAASGLSESYLKRVKGKLLRRLLDDFPDVFEVGLLQARMSSERGLVVKRKGELQF